MLSHTLTPLTQVKRTVIASFSAAFGASGVTFLIFGLINGGTGWSLTALFYGFAVLLSLSILQQLLVQPSKVFPVGAKLEFQTCWPPGFVIADASDGEVAKPALNRNTKFLTPT